MVKFDILIPMGGVKNIQFRRVKMLYEGNHSMISATRTNMVMRRRLNHRRPLLFCLLNSSAHGLWKKYAYAKLIAISSPSTHHEVWLPFRLTRERDYGIIRASLRKQR